MFANNHVLKVGTARTNCSVITLQSSLVYGQCTSSDQVGPKWITKIGLHTTNEAPTTTTNFRTTWLKFSIQDYLKPNNHFMKNNDNQPLSTHIYF